MIILTINSGSSSLKASLFKGDGSRANFSYGQIGHGALHNHDQAFNVLLQQLGDDRPTAVGHRFVHGGEITEAVRLIDSAERERLADITALAPLHMPANLLGVDLCQARFAVPQFACFDTAFHASLPELAWRLPIPRSLGLRRYGFHGINYAYVARQLPGLIGDTACKRVLVAHLGSGASLCLLENLQSVDTSMGYTPAGGIPMGTRSGDLDPGVMLALAQRYNSDELATMVYQHMGLLALSDGESNEMSELLQSTSHSARFAVQYFTHQVRAAIGSYAAKAGGLDALVFTGGIGEHAASVRSQICEPLSFLGFALDKNSNQTNATILNTPTSKPVVMIAADEEAEIAHLVTMKLPTAA